MEQLWDSQAGSQATPSVCKFVAGMPSFSSAAPIPVFLKIFAAVKIIEVAYNVELETRPTRILLGQGTSTSSGDPAAYVEPEHEVTCVLPKQSTELSLFS